jgi:H+-transporting ATPase
VARRDDGEGSWRYLGILPFADPPREDSAETLRAAREMGVRVKMITGDHAAIAREIAAQLGLGQRIVPADQAFRGGAAPDDRAIEEVDGFAQVFPEHKFAIVAALQRLGHIVGMTGDGVNDAPALKKADVGTAVSGATDAARSAADLVLTAPGLSVIVEAVKEARRIFERMNAYAIYRIAETVRVLLFMTFAIMVFDFYPVTPVMIILLALLNDGPIMMIAYDRTKEAPRPVRWEMRLVLSLAAVLGIAGVFSSFGMFWIGEEVLRLDRPTVQTLMFLKLAVAGHMTIYLTRTIDRPFWQKPWPGPALFWIAELTQLAATVFAVYGWFMEPIGWELAGLVWGYAIAWFLLNEAIKRGAHRLLTHAGRGESAHLLRISSALRPGSRDG